MRTLFRALVPLSSFRHMNIGNESTGAAIWKKRLLLLGGVCGTLILAVACGSELESEAAGNLEEEYDVPARRSRITLGNLPPMPDYPDSVAGHLVAVSAGDFPIDSRWRAEAGSCPSVGTIELYTEALQNGMGMLLHFPDSQVVGTYTVLSPDSGLGEGRVARIGVQFFREARNDAFGFHGIDGQVEISEAGGHLSGKFQVTLQETQIEILTRYAGVFSRIPLEQLPDDYCTGLSDSLRVRATESDTATVELVEGMTGS